MTVRSAWRYFSAAGNSILTLQTFKYLLPAATWCKVRHSRAGTPTSFSGLRAGPVWAVIWPLQNSDIPFSSHWTLRDTFTSDCRGFLWWVPKPLVFPSLLCCTSMLSSFFCRPTLSTLQWMENILVLLPKHRQEHGLCRRTAACALLQVFSYRAVFSWSLIATPTPCKPL